MKDFGLTIDGKHTSEFGLRMTSMYIPLPNPKLNKISIPGTSGAIDLSEVLGIVNYEERSGVQFEFTVTDERYEVWASTITKIAMWIHGRKVKVVPDNDIGFYYMCRLAVDSTKNNQVLSNFKITGTAEPFKCEVQASDEEWMWDTFNFETGVIRELADMEITSSNKEITVLGGGEPTCPEFIVKESVNLALIHDGSTYNMPAPGTYRFPQVKVGADDVIFTFSGTGKLSVRYRGRYL